MLKFLSKNKYSLIIATFFIFYGYTHSNTALDLQFGDTYYVIGLNHIYYFLAAAILTIDIAHYEIAANGYLLNKKLKVAHTIFAVIALITGYLLVSTLNDFRGAFIFASSPDGTDSIRLLLRSLAGIVIGCLTISLILIFINFRKAIKKGKLFKPDTPSDDAILDEE